MIALILILVVVLAIVQYRSTLDPLNGIGFDYHCTKLLVEPDEEFEVITTLTNAKRRFVPYVKLDQIFPGELSVNGVKPSLVNDGRNYSRYTATIYLMPRSQQIRRMTGSMPHRGRYIFQGAYLRGGDFMGFSDQLRKDSLLREIVVYPKEIQVGNIDMVMGGIMGDISVRRLVIEDPILVVGFREYTGREPMKAISWNHSARVGKLMVKQFDHTIDPAISVILDVEGSGREGDNDRKEIAFSLARSVCQNLENQGMKYDFLTNATTSDSFARWSYVAESIGRLHFSVIMEGLGRATYIHVESLKRLSETFVGKRLYDRFVILVTVKDREDVAGDIAYIENNNGGKVFAISAGEFLYESGVLSETAV